MKSERVGALNAKRHNSGAVVYWMNRDQRVNDNWALLFAQQMAIQYKVPLSVIFCLSKNLFTPTKRHLYFIIDGLKLVEKELNKKNISFFLLTGNPETEIPNFIKDNNVGLLVSDFLPLNNFIKTKNKIASKIKIPFYETDAHNIIPAWITSQKQEFGAYTIRPKILRLLSDYLEEFPSLIKHKYNWPDKASPTNWDTIKNNYRVNSRVGEVDWIKSGENEAKNILENFIDFKLKSYDTLRNDPNKNCQSDLSPYLHFGQISAQRIALEIMKHNKHKKSSEAFLEELIVRRELSDNFCLYNPNYDNFDGLPNWAKDTLNKHRSDKREFVYELEEFELAKTHDELWNAAQKEMVNKGKMHGFMRMYWAKKILEWSRTPEDAIATAIYLNDKYELDGYDPNGYAGVMWSIGGLHDRAWGERSVFGKIRYMNTAGCKRKFDIKEYINNHCCV